MLGTPLPRRTNCIGMTVIFRTNQTSAMSGFYTLVGAVQCRVMLVVVVLAWCQSGGLSRRWRKLVGNLRLCLLSSLSHLVSSLAFFHPCQTLSGRILRELLQGKQSNWHICWSAEGVIDKQVAVEVIQLIVMIKSKSQVRLTRMVGGRAFNQQLILFTCLATWILFLPAEPEDNRRCY